MEFLELLLGRLGLLKGLLDSMSESKVLTVMVFLMLTFFIGFTVFLVKMAGAQ